MVERQGGYRKKTRHKLAKPARSRGKISMTRLLQKFKVGDRVTINIEPAVHRGMPDPRYQGLVGAVTEARGSSYMVAVSDLGKAKYLICKPVHLTRI